MIDRNGSVTTHTKKNSRLENKTEEREGITMSLSKKLTGFRKRKCHMPQKKKKKKNTGQMKKKLFS